MVSRIGTHESSKPHVVVVPFPLQGHINPLMQLCKLLAVNGVIITFVSSEFNIQRILQARQEHRIADTGLDIRLVGIPDGLPSNHERDPMDVSFVLALEAMGRAFDDLLQNFRSEGVEITCVIADSYLLWAQRAAKTWSIPIVSYWPNSLAVFACNLQVPEIMSSGINPFKVEEDDNCAGSKQLVNCIGGVPPLHPSDLPFKTLHGEDSAQWLYSRIKEQFACLHEARCIVTNSFDELERPVCEHLLTRIPRIPTMYALGPLLPHAFLHEGDPLDTGVGASMRDEDECVEWLNTQQASSVLYISLGSITKMCTQEIQEMAFGLAASKQPFLWVLRRESEDVEAEDLPEGLERQGRMIRWAPQLRVLSHKAVGGFLTHCGWNSTLESISMGVPMIGWPRMLDQATNCWYVVKEWKVGVKLEKGDRQEVEMAVKQVMQGTQGEEMRSRASMLKHAAVGAVGPSIAQSKLREFLECIVGSL